MSNQGSSNHGPEGEGDHHISPPQSPNAGNNSGNAGASGGDNLTPREEQLMMKMTDILRTTFEAFRKEEREKDKGKDKIMGDSSNSGRFVTFKSFKANGATEFEGLTDPVAALLWLENTEKVFRIARVASEDETVYAGALLTKQALTWWNNLGKSIGIKERDEMPFEIFKARFTKQYCPKDIRRRLEKEFMELKQNDLTVNEYERIFNEKAQFATRYLPTEAEKIDIFVEGLRFEIKDFVTVRKIKSFHKAVEYARRREHELVSRGELNPVTKKPRIERSDSAPTPQFRRFNSNKKSFSQGASRAQSRSQSQSFSLQV